MRENGERDAKKRNKKKMKKKMEFQGKKGPKTGTTQGQLRGQKRGKKGDGPNAVATENALGGPIPTMKETFLQENNCTSKTETKTAQGLDTVRKGGAGQRTNEPNTLLRSRGDPGPERISIAVGNIPAPGLGKLGAMQLCSLTF